MYRTMSIFAALALTMGASTAMASPIGINGRTGATFGIGIGGGHIGCPDNGCEDLTGSGSFSLHGGAIVGGRVAVLGDLWWMVHEDRDLSVNQGMLTGAVRVWPLSGLWLQGGLGVARLGVRYDPGLIVFERRTEWVPAFNLGLGVEPIATDSFGLDLHLKYGTGFYSDGEDRVHNVSLNLGLSFY